MSTGPLDLRMSEFRARRTPIATQPRRLFIKTYGCQMNDYDSARIADVLAASHQLELTNEPSEADVLLLNTCSVREKPQEKVYSELGRWRSLKHNRPDMVIGVGGCVASQESEAIIKRAPYVDIVFGPQTLQRLPEMLDRVIRHQQPAIDTTFPEIEKFDRLPEPGVKGPRAYVSIMEGCSRYCTFCIVPYTRGEEFSRTFDDVIAEVAHLAENGVREVTLLGQNVNAYQGTMHSGDVADLALLIHYVAEIDGIDRIRFTTSHPAAFTDRLIDVFADVPKLADHLHLPVQSGSDRILAMMKRGYTVQEYRNKVRRLREVRPEISVSSDFIVGFPGETEADFEATMNLVEEVGFDNSYSFIFSARPGTPAARIPDSTPPEIKAQRLVRLQEQLAQIRATISDRMRGTIQRVLVEGPSPKSIRQLTGRTPANRVVNFVDDDLTLVGQLVNVEITEALPNSLRGRRPEPGATSPSLPFCG